jgi:flagellar hook protein FlgE
MPNFSVPLTGLQADTIALNAIGNNLANINTTAFKGETTSFEDLFYQQIGTSGSGNFLQIGVGTKVSGTTTDFSQGTLSTTTTSTDLALNGDGFFVVQNGNDQYLTRAGDFSLSDSGALQTSEGDQVMGYGVANGAVNENGGLVGIQIPTASTEAALATQNVSLTTTLDSGAATGTIYSTGVTVYDSLGQSHLATVTYTKDSPTTWGYSVTLPSGDSTGTPGTANTGTLTFDSNGNLVSPTGNVTGVSFPGMADGASTLNFNLNLYGANGAPLVSQTSGASNTSASSQDGYASGNYQGFAVNGNGLITASFSNGHTAVVGQVAVASVTNEDGLENSGSNNFTVTAGSGQATIGTGGVGGRGTIEGEALEQSNVDIAAEFSNLIVAQRAFEANSKTVTTFDSVTQEAIGMIR